MKLELTAESSMSSYGIPVFLIDGEPVGYAEGVRALRELKGWGVAEMAEQMGASKRTVEGWEQGRPVKPMALKLMQTFL